MSIQGMPALKVQSSGIPPDFLTVHNRHGRVLLAILVAALGIRIFLIFYFNTWHISSEADHWSFGFEVGRVARSLAEGRGFESPFQEPTGPTAWVAPAYPWLLSLLFRIFGTFSPAAALAALFINALLSAITCLLVYQSGRMFFDQATGLLAAIIFSMAPASIWHAITTVWDTTASAMLLALLIYSLRRLELSPSLKSATVTGITAGILALLNPASMIVYAAGVAYICISERNHLRSLPALLALLAGLPAVICLPWIVRNELVLRQVTIKSNFGTELRIGNNPLAPASASAAVMYLHPTVGDFDLYVQLGESGYVDWCRREAVSFIQENPIAFLKLVARRVVIFWAGQEDNNWSGNLKTAVRWSTTKQVLMSSWGILACLGLAGFRARNHMLLLLTMAAYPLPYYLTHSTSRYRQPLEPVLAVLVAHALIWVWQRIPWHFGSMTRPSGFKTS